MKLRSTKLARIGILCCIACVPLACSDSPTEPGDSVNPALLEAAGEGDFASDASLPQGSGTFTGPGGMRMDATARESIQQLTWKDGRIWRTSQLRIIAVPDESVLGAPFAAIGFGAYHPGSLSSAPPGTYPTITEYPQFNFVDPVLFGIAFVRNHDLRDTLAGEGTVRIHAVEYNPQVDDCALYDGATFAADSCTSQIGIVRGEVTFTTTLADGSRIVQERTSFTLPLERRTHMLREK